MKLPYPPIAKIPLSVAGLFWIDPLSVLSVSIAGEACAEVERN